MPDTQGGIVTSLVSTARQSQGVGFNFYGPGQPLNPILADQQVRQFDFAPGTNTNITPRHAEPFNFAHLRAFANVELVRMAIETRKDQLENLEWQIKARDNKKDNPDDARVKAITKFLSKPDGVTPFASFMRALDEDLLALDAPVLECIRTRGGKLAGLEMVDGATINLMVDNNGRIPRGADDIAYQQIVRGVVWANLSNRDLLYLKRNVRAHHLYGFGPVEQIIVTINTILRRQASQLAYFTEGNVPAGYMQAPEGTSTAQIRELQLWFDERLAGNIDEKRKIVWGPHGSVYTAFKEAPLKNEFDEWLARLVANAFSLPPTPFIRAMNKGTAGEDQDRAIQEGLEPLKLWRKRWIDDLIDREFGAPDLEFAFVESIDLDPTKQSEINDRDLKNGSSTIDEIRDRRGEDPLPNGLGARPLIYAGTNVFPIEAIDALIDKQTAPPPAPVMAPGAPQPEQGPKAPANENPPAKPGAAAAEKLEKGFRSVPPHALALSVDRPKALRAAAALKRALKPIFDKASHDLAAQVERAIAKAGPDATSQADAIVETLDFAFLFGLKDPIEAELIEVGEDIAREALAAIGVKASSELVNRVNARAVEYAKERAADLVSLKGDESLIESTRNMLRRLIAGGLEDNIGRDAIAQSVQDATAFSEFRAELIADTEISMANSASKDAAWEEARSDGITLMKEWFVSGDEGVCPVCEGNGDQGEIDYDEPFESGDDMEPAHPGCRCVTVARAIEADGTDDGETDKAAKAAAPALPAIEITVPVTVHTGKASFERTIVTKHDEQGRILEFERHQIEEPE